MSVSFDLGPADSAHGQDVKFTVRRPSQQEERPVQNSFLGTKE